MLLISEIQLVKIIPSSHHALHLGSQQILLIVRL